MDEKLEMMLDFRLWEELFPEFRAKKIDPDVLAMLSQPRYRLGLVQMIRDGVYGFGAPREVEIPKDDGGKRLIYVLSDIDRCTMAVIARVYTKLYGSWIHPSCKSYQKGLSVPATLHQIRHRLGAGGYKVDLSKYFDSVPRWKINEMLERMGTGSPVDKLLWDFYNTDLIQRDDRTVEHFKSLGQGCAFSPLLANLCLADVDEALSGICDVYLRYSDDILMLGRRANESLRVLEEKLSNLELSLNPKKVLRICDNTEFTFLGGRVCRDWIRMSEKSWRKQKKAVKRMVRKYGKKGNRDAQRKTVNALKRYFLGVSGGYCMLEYFCFLCTDETDIQRLDNYCRDEIKAAYTGCHNHATNEHKTSNELIRTMGWVSLVHLYHLYKMSPDVFRAKLAALRETVLTPKEVESVNSVFLHTDVHVNLASGLVKCDGHWYKVDRKDRTGVLQRIEELWEKARLFEGFTALNVSPDRNRVYSSVEADEIDLALKEIELLIVTTKWNFTQYFWQSERYPELVVFREWAG